MSGDQPFRRLKFDDSVTLLHVSQVQTVQRPKFRSHLDDLELSAAEVEEARKKLGLPSSRPVISIPESASLRRLVASSKSSSYSSSPSTNSRRSADTSFDDHPAIQRIQFPARALQDGSTGATASAAPILSEPRLNHVADKPRFNRSLSMLSSKSSVHSNQSSQPPSSVSGGPPERRRAPSSTADLSPEALLERRRAEYQRYFMTRPSVRPQRSPPVRLCVG